MAINTNLNAGPIGIFDSGYGGLTILSEIKELMPQYDYIYLGDNARTPYGSRSNEFIYKFTLQAVKWLFTQGCQLIIIACNTASAIALRCIQQNDLPQIDHIKRVLGVVQPTAEIIAKYTRTGHVALLGTEGTIKSQTYEIEIKKLHPQIQLSTEACPMWVPLVENGEYNKPGADYFVKQHLTNIIDKDNESDAIILGCTHYPLLINKIKQFTPEGISIISQGEHVAHSLKNYLERHKEMNSMCSKNTERHYYTTESVEKFKNVASFFLNEAVVVEKVNIEIN